MYTLRDLAARAELPAKPAPHLVTVPAETAASSHPVSRTAASSHAGHSFPALPEVSLVDALSWLLRRWTWIVTAAVIGVLVGVGFGLMAKPRYTVYTDLLVPPANLQLLPNDLYTHNLQADSQILDVESKLRILTSGNVLRRVVKDLNLENDPEFVRPAAAFSLASLFGGDPKAAGDTTLAAMRSLSERISAQRQERSYLITISVWTQDSDKSVLVADTLAQAFRDEVAQADADAAGRATSALSERLSILQKSATESEEKVAAFRRENGLQTNGGELISAQSMSQISERLGTARAQQAEAASRYGELTASGPNALDPAGSLQSATITALRTQYATLKQRYDGLAMTYGARYPELINTQMQMAGLEQQIAQERTRIVRAAKVDLDQANAVVDALNSQAATARSALSLDNDAQVQLNDLQREMAAKVAIYQTFLTRAAETSQQQQIDSTNIRVISTAIPPLSRSWPPRTVLLAIAGLCGGAALGMGLALLAGFGGAWRSSSSSA